MSCSDELAVLGEEDLIDIILRDDIPCSKIPVEENGLLEDCNLQDPELLDKELDDLINSVLGLIEDKPGTLQGCYPPDSGISEYCHLSHIPGSNSVSIPWSSGTVQVDHNYSLHEDWPGLQSVMSDMAQQDVSIGFGTWMGLEGASRALEQSFSFPMVVDVDNGPQFLSEAIMQAEKLLLKKVRRRIRNKQSARNSRNSRRRRRMFEDGLEYRLLPKRLRKLQALVRKPTTKAMRRKACTMVSGFSPSVCEGVSAILIGWGERHYLQLVMSLAEVFGDLLPSSRSCFLSFCLILFPCSEPEELRVLSQQIPEFSGQLKPHLQEDSVVEGFNPEPKDPFIMSGSLNMLQEEGQSPPNPDPGLSLYSGSSSDPMAAIGSEQSPPQPPCSAPRATTSMQQ
ncbi:cyclic AMP-responsive element-binding protein 3 isoform X3 [Phaenicophaeus curvirostris]|uniref:cyclic AMP-responsive element-binding protein 3 isoform X3 n=1 Tax=Phaenicophaeus curvirostris TaxID=33595 RepID=UPI0037F0A72F